PKWSVRLIPFFWYERYPPQSGLSRYGGLQRSETAPAVVNKPLWWAKGPMGAAGKNSIIWKTPFRRIGHGLPFCPPGIPGVPRVPAPGRTAAPAPDGPRPRRAIIPAGGLVARVPILS